MTHYRRLLAPSKLGSHTQKMMGKGIVSLWKYVGSWSFKLAKFYYSREYSDPPFKVKGNFAAQLLSLFEGVF